jgi:5-methylcytosine-specific restriction endonuclease McrA
MAQRSGNQRRNLKPEIKDKVRQRDDSRCRLCLEHQDDLKKQLQVHHIRPVEMGGRDRFKNLISLCDLCHRIVHKNVERYIDPMRKYVELLNQTGQHNTIDSIERGYYLGQRK